MYSSPAAVEVALEEQVRVVAASPRAGGAPLYGNPPDQAPAGEVDERQARQRAAGLRERGGEPEHERQPHPAQRLDRAEYRDRDRLAVDVARLGAGRGDRAAERLVRSTPTNIFAGVRTSQGDQPRRPAARGRRATASSGGRACLGEGPRRGRPATRRGPVRNLEHLAGRAILDGPVPDRAPLVERAVVYAVARGRRCARARAARRSPRRRCRTSRSARAAGGPGRSRRRARAVATAAGAAHSPVAPSTSSW